jgi:hypothetical protein
MLARLVLGKKLREVDSEHAIKRIDRVIENAVLRWRRSGLGFLHPREALQKFSLTDLCVVREQATTVLPIVEDGEPLLPSCSSELDSWRPLETALVIVRAGYTFLLFKLQVYYCVIDTHHNSILRNSPALASYATVSTGSSGLLLRTLFFAEAKQFILNYGNSGTQLTSSHPANQIDLTFVALDAKNTESQSADSGVPEAEARRVLAVQE